MIIYLFRNIKIYLLQLRTEKKVSFNHCISGKKINGRKFLDQPKIKEVNLIVKKIKKKIRNYRKKNFKKYRNQQLLKFIHFLFHGPLPSNSAFMSTQTHVDQIMSRR